MEANRLRMRKTAHERPETAKCHRRAILVVEPHCSGHLRAGLPGAIAAAAANSRSAEIGRPLRWRRTPRTSRRCAGVVARENVAWNGGRPPGESGWSQSPARTAEGVSGCDRLACFPAASAAALSRRQKSASPKLSSTKDDFGWLPASVWSCETEPTAA